MAEQYTLRNGNHYLSLIYTHKVGVFNKKRCKDITTYITKYNTIYGAVLS